MPTFLHLTVVFAAPAKEERTASIAAVFERYHKTWKASLEPLIPEWLLLFLGQKKTPPAPGANHTTKAFGLPAVNAGERYHLLGVYSFG